jgi:hypothetical protein
MSITITELLTTINAGDLDSHEKKIFSALNSRARQKYSIKRQQGKIEALTAGMEDGDLVRLEGMRKYLDAGSYTFRGFAPRSTAYYAVETKYPLYAQSRLKYPAGHVIHVPIDCVKLVTKEAECTDVAA